MTTAPVHERPMLGGPLALELLNTSWGLPPDVVDWLDDDQAVLAFVNSSNGGSVARSDVGDARASLVRARRLIEQLLDATQLPEVTEIDAALTLEINEMLAQAVPVFALSRSAERLLTITGNAAGNAVAIAALVNAIELVEHHRNRVRSCDHESCVLWFHDTSKAGRRRWCSMGGCGNRAKARRHYARRSQLG